MGQTLVVLFTPSPYYSLYLLFQVVSFLPFPCCTPSLYYFVLVLSRYFLRTPSSPPVVLVPMNYSEHFLSLLTRTPSASSVSTLSTSLHPSSYTFSLLRI